MVGVVHAAGCVGGTRAAAHRRLGPPGAVRRALAVGCFSPYVFVPSRLRLASSGSAWSECLCPMLLRGIVDVGWSPRPQCRKCSPASTMLPPKPPPTSQVTIPQPEKVHMKDLHRVKRARSVVGTHASRSQLKSTTLHAPPVRIRGLEPPRTAALGPNATDALQTDYSTCRGN